MVPRETSGSPDWDRIRSRGGEMIRDSSGSRWALARRRWPSAARQVGPGLEPEEYSCDGKCRVGAAYALRTSYTGGVDAPRTHSTDNCGKTVEMVDIGVCTRWWKKDMPWNRADAGSTSANEN